MVSAEVAAGRTPPIAGSIVALVTPMTHAGAVDYPALARLVAWHISAGTNAIVAVGTTGESATLNVDEHCEVIACVIKSAAGRIPVIAGTGANSTSEAIELTHVAKRLGANACLSVTPYYNKPTQQGLYLHHKSIAEAVDIPNILYNVPGRTAVDMLPETTARLAAIENIIGIKDATGDLHRGAQLLQLCGKQIAIYSGDDATAIELILLGGAGNISVTANVVPAKIAALCAKAMAARNGPGPALEQLRAEDHALADLHNAMFVEANPIPVKWALQRMGAIDDGIRLPLTPLDDAYHEQVEQALQGAGALQPEVSA
ncbi:MAG: 4-hydroxy-tetrahydrodipicolinate synthase [Gammaproteobacteria bacterium]|nr:4-hydroxy-tetrahydrodipicolinate synthase [Gammaproteobacteria bacterium]